MRPRTQKQPQVKKELCRALDDVDVDVDVHTYINLFACFYHPFSGTFWNDKQGACFCFEELSFVRVKACSSLWPLLATICFFCFFFFVLLYLQALLSSGAVKISAYVTHAVFPRESWKGFTDCEVKFEKFYITDSLPHASHIAEHSPFKLLSLCDSISEALLGFDLLQSWTRSSVLSQRK